VPHALEYLALNHALMGKNADALEDARRAVAADPLSATARATYAQILYIAGRCGEAMPILDSMNVMQPPPLRVAVTRSLCYDDQHRWADAQAAVRQQATKDGVHSMAILGLALGLSGEKQKALDIRSKIRTTSQANPAYYDLAIVSYGLGDMDDTFANLDRAASNGAFFFEILGPVFDSLHRDPRFKAIAGKHGIGIGGN
jgi:tetratricopeptide (TPR) repeat protein